jgi:hypothetical protein
MFPLFYKNERKDLKETLVTFILLKKKEGFKGNLGYIYFIKKKGRIYTIEELKWDILILQGSGIGNDLK